jgi:hypothetical protein
VVSALEYLTEPEYSSMHHAKVFNLCRHYRYQALGYYVSLLAEARGHRPIPTVLTIQDLRSPALVRMASDDLEGLIRAALAPVEGDRFSLEIYFGRAVDRRFERLATALFIRTTTVVNHYTYHFARRAAAEGLVLAQEFVPTPFDWRFGVLDRRPLFAAR